MIGTTIDGKYHIEKRIGKGGFAEVFRGKDIRLDRYVAVKFLSITGTERDAKLRFLKESQVMAKVKHPNIVTLHDCGDHAGQPYLVMEYVNGPSLHELATRMVLPLATVARIGESICQAMAHAHTQGVVHRDLTLRNVLVEHQDQEINTVKVMDFGLVKIMDDWYRTTCNAIKGTPAYMAPELIKGEAIGPASDVFSFGVCLYYLANGRFPFIAEHPTAVMYLIVNEQEAACEPDVAAPLVSILQRCLIKDPARRPSFEALEREFSDLTLSGDEPSMAAEATPNPSAVAPMIADRTSKTNPYLNRIMIENSRDFFGRDREVRKIFSRLDAPHPQSISIVGERRIGKSSLLNHIYNRETRRQHMTNHEDSIFAYLDFQSKVDFDIERFIDFVLAIIGYETRAKEKYDSMERSLDQLQEVVVELHEQGKRIIILMDEFESITRNQNFDDSFFAFLRSLANSYRVAYVTSSLNELQHMCHNRQIADSPFFNIFSNLPLRPFQSEEANELIATPSSREGLTLAPYAERILDLAGQFPLYLQIACSCVFETMLYQEDHDPDWQRAGEMYLDEARPHYDFVWEHMDDLERENLIRVALGRSIGRKFEHISQNLVRKGYLVQTDDGFRVCSATFGDFVLEQSRSGGSRGPAFLGWIRRLGRGGE